MEQNKAQELDSIKKKLKELFVAHLSLGDKKPEDIKDDELLFGEGLGLDSLDAVEIVVILQRNFGIQIKNMEQGKKIFLSIDTLAKFIQEKNTSNEK